MINYAELYQSIDYIHYLLPKSYETRERQALEICLMDKLNTPGSNLEFQNMSTSTLNMFAVNYECYKGAYYCDGNSRLDCLINIWKWYNET